MASPEGEIRRSPIERLARIAFTFVMMNVAAVAGVIAAITGKRVWR